MYPTKVILHIGPLPPPTGGVALALQMILKCEGLQGYTHQVFNTSHGQRTETVGRKGITLRRIWRQLTMAVAVARQVLRERPDLIHFQCGSESFFNIIGDALILWASHIAGSPTILHLHVDPARADLPGRKSYTQCVFRQLIRPVHSIFVLTEDYRCFLMAEGGIDRPVYVVPNMCDESLLDIPIELKRASGDVRAIFLGRLTQPKGIYDLIAVAERLLRNAKPRIYFDVAGLPNNVNEERLIQELVNQGQLQNTVHFHGLVTSEDKKALFERADIVFVPSHHESFGIVAIEGMAAGLPVLATRAGGLQSIISDNKTGFLVEIGDIDRMEALLLNLASDAQLRLQMGSTGRRQFLARYTGSQVGNVINTAYSRVLELR